jgi:hypothetical protein
MPQVFPVSVVEGNSAMKLLETIPCQPFPLQI